MVSGEQVYVPIVWFWERLARGSKGDIYVYLSYSLLLNFILFFFGSVLELFSWFFYLGGYYEWAYTWFSTVGLYTSTVLYPWPAFFALTILLPQWEAIPRGSLELGAWFFTSVAQQCGYSKA